MISFLLLSCSDNLLTKVYEEESSIYVIPDSIDFGDVGVSSFSQESITIINAGSNQVLLEDIVINSYEFYSDEINNLYINPDEIIDINVYFEPQNFGLYENNLELTHNDIDGESHVGLFGRGTSSSIVVEPSELNFGGMEVGCSAEEIVTIKNIGNSDLVIDSINQISINMSEVFIDYGSLPSFPWILVPSQEVDIVVGYSPLDIGLDQASLVIESNDPNNNIFSVYQSGEGISEYRVKDTFLQKDIVLSDIIFILDNSGSMSGIQNSLSNQIYSFMETINELNLDYRLGFSSTDSSNFYEADGLYWIDNLYTNPEIWSQDVISSIGTSGSGTEKGIEFSANLLQNNGVNGAGSFLRADANLAIIYISDEKDHSTGGWNMYTNFFDSIKSQLGMLNVFSVIGDHPSGCNTSSGRHIEFGEGYYEITNYYSGHWFSICDESWGIQLQEIAASIADRRAFELSNENPKESSIKVYVNGQEVLCWEYDPISNSIIFDEDEVPEVSQTIEIEYAIETC